MVTRDSQMLRWSSLKKAGWLIVIALTLSIAACSPTVEEQRATATVAVAQTAEVTQEQSPTPTSTLPKVTVTRSPTATLGPTLTTGPVAISVAKTVYQQGEPIEYTITNHLARAIFWVYGCSWPVPVYIQENKRTRLIISIEEALPPIAELPPGESVTCVWDQQAYQAPGIAVPERFKRANVQTQVPPGRYQFLLSYSFSEEEAETKPRLTSEPPIIYSPVFTIEE